MTAFTGDIQILLYTEEENFFCLPRLLSNAARTEAILQLERKRAGLRRKVPGWPRYNQRTLSGT